MTGPSLFTMLQFAAGLSMAGPIFFIGFEYVRMGRPVAGAGFFAIALCVTYAPTYFLRQIGGPRAWLRRRLRRGRSETERSADGSETTESERESRLRRLGERLRR